MNQINMKQKKKKKINKNTSDEVIKKYHFQKIILLFQINLFFIFKL